MIGFALEVVMTEVIAIVAVGVAIAGLILNGQKNAREDMKNFKDQMDDRFDQIDDRFKKNR